MKKATDVLTMRREPGDLDPGIFQSEWYDADDYPGWGSRGGMRADEVSAQRVIAIELPRPAWIALGKPERITVDVTVAKAGEGE